jgi:hypothetical protein
MTNQNTEADKREYLNVLLGDLKEGWLNDKESTKLVRRKIREIWGLKKSAANEKFRKLFGYYKVAVDSPVVGTVVTDSFNTQVIDKGTGEVIMDTNWVPIQLGEPPVGGFKVSGDKATLEIKNAGEIRTLEDLVAFCKVDLNKWEPKSFVPSLQRGVLNLRAEFKKRVDQDSLSNLLETFTKQANERAPATFNIKPITSSGDDLYVISIQDLHIGKLAHGVQTLWGDFDISIAKKYYKDAAEQLISEAPVGKIGKVLLIIGSDLIHYENQRVETSSGTKIEGDSRWHKVFDESCQLIAETVESLAVQFPVEVMVVAGNHANLSEYALGAYIKAFFRNHPNINVNNEPSNRKYFAHGKTLIGFAHGNGVKKLEDLGAVMMREKMEVISNYKHLYWLTGHKHVFQQMLDSRGVRIFVSAALCNPDQWHSENSYVGNIQGSEGYLFSPVDGLTQIIFSKSVNVK